MSARPTSERWPFGLIVSHTGRLAGMLSVGEERTSAEIEITRADENASVRFGARYADAIAGACSATVCKVRRPARALIGRLRRAS